MRNESRQKQSTKAYFRVDCLVVCNALVAKFFNKLFGVVCHPQPNTIHENFVHIRVADSGWVINVGEEIDEAQRPSIIENLVHRMSGVHVN